MPSGSRLWNAVKGRLFAESSAGLSAWRSRAGMQVRVEEVKLMWYEVNF
jgi:hypothetical protein